MKVRFIFIWSLVLSLIIGLASPALAANPDSKIEDRPVQSSKQDEPQTVIEKRSENNSSKTIPNDYLVTNEKTEQIGTGVQLTTFERFDVRGWINGELLTVDLGNKAVSADLLHPGVVSKAEPLSESAIRKEAIAGVNGDFFDINGTKAPLGAEIENGEIVKGPENGREQSAGVTVNGIGQLADILLEGSIGFNGEVHPLSSFNQYSIPTNGIGLYTSLWGSASRNGAVSGSKSIHEIIVKDGKVIASNESILNGAILENQLVLIGRENGAAILKQLNVGDDVSIQYSPKVVDGEPFKFAIGGNPMLVKDGVVLNLDDSTTAPRTAVGYSADGKQMYLLIVDGRQTSSRGLTLYEMGKLMKEFGSHHALNLDGGGSTTMVARTPGKEDAEVVNSPSDGTERAVPNGIGIFTEKGNGILSGLNVFTHSTLENSDRVFPGLTRSFSTSGYDNAYDPVQPEKVTWKAKSARFGRIDKDGTFLAKESGKVDVEAAAGKVVGSTSLTVLGELDRLEANTSRLGLAAGATGRFYINGYDENGYSAPIESQDITLEYDQSVIDIQKLENGYLLVTPKVDEGASLVTATVNGKEAYLSVTVGLKTEVVSEMESLLDWRFTSARGSGVLETAEGRNGNGLKVEFDFTKSTGTRTANSHPTKPIILPGEPQSINMWVKGDGKGEWMSFTTRGADGSMHYLYGPYVTWTGWKQIEIPVPAGVTYPLELRTIGAIETNKAQQYTGELVYDDLSVKVSPTVEVPVVPEEKDPLVLQNVEIGEDRWKFAVMSDSQFVGAAPNSQQVRLARESLQQIVQQNPEFLIVGGDLVDTAYPEDFELAKKILEEEVGDKFPIYFVPGNHEIMGTGNLDNFMNSFKENKYFFQNKGTKFALLDTSKGSFRTSDFEQMIQFKRTLDSAASDPNIKNLVVFGHHPTRDPLSTQNSQLSDRKEAELIENWLTEFREESGGKGVIYLAGHAHTVNVERVDGVPYMVMGPTGKAPYGPPDDGGFYAWTMFGVDPSPIKSKANGPKSSKEQSPARDTEWIRADVNPLLEGITLDAPLSVITGETVKVAATGNQAGNLNFPLRYPASVNWIGSENVFIGIGEEFEKAKKSNKYDAVFNHQTGELTGLKKGQIQLKVESNGVTAEQNISIL